MKYILYRVIRTLLYPIFLLVYRPEFEGRNNIPKSGSVILAGNHTNNLDAAIMLAGPKRVVHMLAKKELFKSKISNVFFRSMGCIPVDRKIHDENAKSEAREILNNKGAIGLFPEGTRNEVTSKEAEIDKVAKILGISHDEVLDKLKDKCTRTTQVNLLIELSNSHKITKDELKEYILDPDESLLKLLKKKIITKDEYKESLLLPFKFGAVSLAKKTGSLIVPYATVGNYNGERDQLITRIGDPIDVSNMELEDANKLLREKIIELMQKI